MAEINVELKNELRDTFSSLRDYFGNYHHHKEKMAWSATVIYMALCFGLLGFASTHTFLWYVSSILSAILLFSFGIAIFFVRNQLWAKDFAAKIVEVSIILSFEIESPMFKLAVDDLEITEDIYLPNLYVRKIKDYKEGRLYKLKKNEYSLRSGGSKIAQITEDSIWIIISLCTLITLFAIWLPQNMIFAAAPAV